MNRAITPVVHQESDKGRNRGAQELVTGAQLSLPFQLLPAMTYVLVLHIHIHILHRMCVYIRYNVYKTHDVYTYLNNVGKYVIAYTSTK